jgi:hypothetical protein
VNIFVVHPDPREAARQLCDRHVVKMTLETAQILSAASHHPDPPYRPTHTSHPCVFWAGENRSNFLWLVEHGLGLADEYTHRYGKVHASASVIQWALAHTDRLPQGDITRHPRCMPREIRDTTAQVVAAYRVYYVLHKPWATWRRGREAPTWWGELNAVE